MTKIKRPIAWQPLIRIERFFSDRRSAITVPLLGALLLALLWGVIAIRLATEETAAQRDAMRVATTLASALEQHTLRAIRHADQLTRFIKFAYESNPNSFDLAQTVTGGVISTRGLIQISRIDQTGQLSATSGANRYAHRDFSDLGYFKTHREFNDDRLIISGPTLGRLSGHWSILVSRRLNRPDGSFAGVVVVSEDPAIFTNDFYSDAALGTRGVISVVSDQGTVLARRAGLEQTTESTQPTGYPITYPVTLQTSGIYKDPIDQMERIVAYQNVAGFPLNVLVGLSSYEKLADYRHSRTIYLLMASFISLAIVALLLVATGLARRLLGREREMTQLVEYDVLTGLPNRYRTLQLLQQEVARESNVGKLALLFIDLDNFKAVNDTLGHQSGDIVLQVTALRLRNTLGSIGSLMHLGGDEFVVVVSGVGANQQAVEVAKAIATAMRSPYDLGGNAFVLNASIGIVLHTNPHDTANDLLKNAELAMYSAKSAGRACFQFYSPQLSLRADHLMKWEQQLRVALQEHQLFLLFQPKVELQRRCITGFEALVNWRHPELGIIGAGEFIPIAESTGLIVPLGNFVIASACRQLGEWQRLGFDALSLAVNISSVQFWRGDLLEVVERCMREHGVPPGRLELEITETAMMEYPDLVSDKIAQLKKLGVRISLDDFGTGYSSLAYLHRFSVDTLKVDRSFVEAIPGDRAACTMVAAMINLARSLGLTVVVEGTETEEQVAWLAKQGRVEAQGYLFSRPAPIHAVPQLLEKFGMCVWQKSIPHLML